MLDHQEHAPIQGPDWLSWDEPMVLSAETARHTIDLAEESLNGDFSCSSRASCSLLSGPHDRQEKRAVLERFYVVR